MVKTGILRTFGEALRSWLATRLSNRFAGFAAGMGLAMLLQSSTAASLLVASLQAGGLVSTAAAPAAALGAAGERDVAAVDEPALRHAEIDDHAV